MKHFGNWFWGSVLGVALLAIVGGFFSGASMRERGAMPAAVQVPEIAPVPIERALTGARGPDSSLEDFDPPIEAAVVDRPEGWAPPDPAPSQPAKLAIVICGMGVDGTLDRRFEAIPYPISFAVAAGGDAPSDVRRADPRELLVETGDASPSSITKLFAQLHAGGVITPLAGHPADADELVSHLSGSNAFLIDGMAGGSALFYQAARDDRVPAATRDIVIDAYEEESYVTYMLRQAVKLAQQTGVAIAVGHAYPETYDALRRDIGRLADADVQVVPVGSLAR